MHDFSTLGRDIQAFLDQIKPSSRSGGGGGDSGDTICKSMTQQQKSVPTRFQRVSPLKNEWGQGVQTSGDRKAQKNESLIGSVPTATTVPTDFEQERTAFSQSEKALRQTHIPDSWRDGYLRLRDAEPLDDFAPHVWSQMVEDAAALLSAWGDQIVRLGWRDVDVFGLNPSAPAARIGCWGIAFTIQGGSVVAVTDTSAAIRRPSGASLTWRRGDGLQVPAWELIGGVR